MAPAVLFWLLLAAVIPSAAGQGASGEIAGRVTLKGTPPPQPAVDRSADPACPPPSAADQPLLVSPDGGLQNVVVRLAAIAPRAPGSTAPPSADGLSPVRVEQRGCSYVPRVQAGLSGQPLEVVNADPLLHNLHVFAGRRGLFNLAQPAGAAAARKDLAGEEIVRLKCDIHPWMFGWIVFNRLPYFAVTDREGNFQLNGIPPGTYRLSGWHELLGTQERTIVVTKGAQRTDLVFEAPAAAPR